jgi:hypothetical protein
VSELKSVRKVRVDADFGDTTRTFWDIDVVGQCGRKSGTLRPSKMHLDVLGERSDGYHGM